MMKVGDDVDVDGPLNTATGYRIAGAGTQDKTLRGSGTAFVSGDFDMVLGGWYTKISPFLGATAFGGAVYSRFLSAASLNNGFGYTTTPALNGGLQWDVSLPAGTYTVQSVGITGNNYAKITAILDGVAGAEVDGYSAGTVYNVYREWTGLVLTGAMKKRTLQLKATSKNVSSTNYFIYVIALAIVRTA